jgi:hypothetical protein
VKTDELITLLARDATPVKRSALPLRLAPPVLAGAVIAFAILVPWLGIRPDLAEAATGATYWMKTLYTFGLGVAGFALVERLSRPGAKGRLGWAMIALWAALAIIFAAAQLMSTPADQMQSALMGSTWDKCPWRILLLSLPGLALTLWTMRGFAPTRPTLAGAAAGLLAGGLAATVYGLHCQETAIPFVAIFYTLGIVLSTATGALIGSRVLRW